MSPCPYSEVVRSSYHEGWRSKAASRLSGMNRFERRSYDAMGSPAELLEQATKPLHRAMLLNFWSPCAPRGRGRFEEIVAPDMMVDGPVVRGCTGGQTLWS